MIVLRCSAKYPAMNNDNEQIQIKFHEKANTLFFALLKSFELAVKELDRQSEEYKFQHLKETYTQSLKQQLENYAMVLMQEHRHNRKEEELSQNLQHHIGQYLHLFVQKTRID